MGVLDSVRPVVPIGAACGRGVPVLRGHLNPPGARSGRMLAAEGRPPPRGSVVESLVPESGDRRERSAARWGRGAGWGAGTAGASGVRLGARPRGTDSRDRKLR